MPKERRMCQARASPYPTKTSSTLPSPPLKSPSPSTKEAKELDQTRCPICLDHPHNAVLLTCKSTAKGCHPYICDTSQLHSNCLDQFKKMSEQICNQTGNTTYSCPLCRGAVTGIVVRNAARDYLNEKVRTCSKESCLFSGTYKELMKHVWKEHPMDRPSEPDPLRQSEWKRLERRSDFGDLVSSIRSDVGEESDAGLTTSVVRIPSMSIVIVVRMNSTRVYTQSARSETIVIDDDDNDDEDINDVDEDNSDDSEYEDEEEEDEDIDEDYVIGSRRR